MSVKVKKCCKCKKEFPETSLINYNGKNYCSECHSVKLNYDMFSKRICEIFNLKMPGPIINKQRDTLNKKGFSDDTIIKTIEYCYYIKRITRPSLDYINTETVDEMKTYNKNMDYKENIMISSIPTITYIERVVPRYAEKEKEKFDDDISKYMEDDVF